MRSEGYSVDIALIIVGRGQPIAHFTPPRDGLAKGLLDSHVLGQRRLVMRTFVALMRGINVGSTRKLTMADLRASCLALGLKRPETYFQSGNLIVDANRKADDLRRVLERGLTSRFGFTVEVIVHSTADRGQYVVPTPSPAMRMRCPGWCICISRAIG